MSRAAESLLELHAAAAHDWSAVLPSVGTATRLNAVVREALANFEEQGIPTRRLESWKGTNLARLEAMDFFHRSGGDSSSNAAAFEAAPEMAADLVFVDGRLKPASPIRAQLPEGIRVLSLLEAATEAPELLESHLARLPELKKEPLAALQTAFFEDVAVVHLEARAQSDSNSERAIRIRSISTSASSSDSPSPASADFPRLLVVAGPGSTGTVVFESESPDEAPGLTAFVAEFHVAEDARVEFVQIQGESAERIHFTSVHARLEDRAHFDSHVFSLGKGLVRSELAVALSGPGAETRMRGFFLGRNKGHIDHFTTVDHQAEHCTSDQEYRGVLGDESKGVFRGRVIVQPGAQKTDARQSNPNLLLSDRATIDTKPQLEIYADDIRASHGSTIGQLDADALFFLRARGIEESLARLVLTRAFAQSIVDGIGDDSVREAVSLRAEEALAALESGAEAEERER